MNKNDISRLQTEIERTVTSNGSRVLDVVALQKHLYKLKAELQQDITNEFLKKQADSLEATKKIHEQMARSQESFQKSVEEVEKKTLKISESQNCSAWLQLVSATVLTIVFIYVTWSLGQDSNKIAEKQTEILDGQTSIMESTSRSIYASIKIIPKGDFNFAAWNLIDMRNFKQDLAARWETFLVSAYNNGSTTPTAVFCNGDWSDKRFFAYFTPDHVFGKVSPEEPPKEIDAHVAYRPCIDFPDKEHCRQELVPIGKQSITLFCGCSGCMNQDEINVTVDFCIFNETHRVC